MEAGLTIETFWRLTWREFVLYRKGYEQRELREWERSRFLGWMIYQNIMKYEKGGKKSLTEFVPLSSDDEEEGNTLTQEQFRENSKKLAEAFKSIKPDGARDLKNNTDRRQQTGFGRTSRNGHKPKRGHSGGGESGASG